MKTLVSFICPICGCTHSVEMTTESLELYYAGALAQDAFPYLNATEREQFISHFCPSCQNEIYGTDDEYDDEDIEDWDD